MGGTGVRYLRRCDWSPRYDWFCVSSVLLFTLVTPGEAWCQDHQAALLQEPLDPTAGDLLDIGATGEFHLLLVRLEEQEGVWP